MTVYHVCDDCGWEDTIGTPSPNYCPECGGHCSPTDNYFP